MELLPSSLVQLIYEFDPTYRDYFTRMVLPQMKRILYLIDLITYESGNIVISQRYCKSVLRSIRKHEIRSVSKATGTRLPRRFTKRRAMLAIIFHRWIHFRCPTAWL